MIGFQQVIPILVVGLLTWFLTPKVWSGLRKGAIQAVRDTKEFGSEISNISKEDTKPKDDNVVEVDTKLKDSDVITVDTKTKNTKL